MKVKKVAEGAYFVPPYFMPNVNSPMPGAINQATPSREEVEEDVSTPEKDTFTKEEFERVLRKVSHPNQSPRVAKKT